MTLGGEMTTPGGDRSRKFFVELIKPSHYDNDGYVIQWLRGLLPSNSLACLYGLATDAAGRDVLGADVEIVVNAYDETNIVVPVEKIIKRIRDAGENGGAGGGGLVCMVGVQTNQFPRAVDLARPFAEAGIPVAIGGFHVSGCLTMLDELTPELKSAVESGITLFGGEAEGRLDELLVDADRGQTKQIYSFVTDLPDLRRRPLPFLPAAVLRRTFSSYTSFDAGRGCPFNCSFCCIINVQGRKSRFREADEIEALVRANAAQGITRYFITDDNFSRNRNWEPILDRLIGLREKEGMNIGLIMQVDMLVHRIPGFIEKAAAAGCRWVFMGLESVNPANLASANKRQNHIAEYRQMLLAWKKAGVITLAGYILGFPEDTPDSIRRDLEIVKRELPIDLLEFFILSPAPGSEDHKKLYEAGVWIDPDINKGDGEHVVVEHPRMSKDEWQAIFHEAWSIYYSDDHVERLMRRAVACGMNPARVAAQISIYSGIPRFEGLHPLQGGLFRRKLRRSRRPGMPRENPLVFYPRRVAEVFTTFVPLILYALRLHILRRRILRDPMALDYTDAALSLDDFELDADYSPVPAVECIAALDDEAAPTDPAEALSAADTAAWTNPDAATQGEAKRRSASASTT